MWIYFVRDQVEKSKFLIRWQYMKNAIQMNDKLQKQAYTTPSGLFHLRSSSTVRSCH